MPSSLNKFFCQLQPWIHHIQPIGMIPSIRFRIRFCCLLRDLFVIFDIVMEIIFIHKILPCIIRRVYVLTVFDTIYKN